MKKLVDPVSSGGFPLFAQEALVDVFSKELWGALEAVLSTVNMQNHHPSGTGAGDGIIVSGGALSGAGPYNIAEGIAYFPTSKSFARFPAATGLAPAVNELYINLQAAIIEQKTFFDSVLKDYSTTISAVASATAATEYVTVRTDIPYSPTVANILNYRVGDMIIREYSMGNWDMTSGSSTAIVVPTTGFNYGFSDIRGIETAVFTDVAVSPRRVRPLEYQNGGYIELVEGSGQFTINLNAVASGVFDNTDYNDGVTTIRGFVTIHYFDEVGF